MRNISFYILVILVFLAPLPFGSNIILAWYWNGALVGCALLLFAFGVTFYYEPISVPFSRIKASSILFFVVVLWGVFQILPLNMQAISHPLWGMGGSALNVQLPGRVSAAPEDGLMGLLRLISYAGVFWLALQFSRDADKAKLLLFVIVGAITIYASYGLLLKVLGSETLLWFEKQHYKTSLTSTFINRNSAATYFGLGCVILLTLFISYLRRKLYQSGPQKFLFSRFIDVLLRKYPMFLIYAFFVTFAALVLTGSRAGLVATIIGLVSLIIIYLMKSGARYFVYASVFGVFALAVVGVLEVGGEYLIQRLQTLQESEGNGARLSAYLLVLTIIQDFPLVGTGLGSFETIFPMYRDSTIASDGVWDKAHNTYLELLMELGIPAAVALFVSVIILILFSFHGFFQRKKNSHFCAIGLACSVLVGVHALVDFSLQIQAVTLTYMALLGIAVSQSWGSRKQNL